MPDHEHRDLRHPHQPIRGSDPRQLRYPLHRYNVRHHLKPEPSGIKSRTTKGFESSSDARREDLFRIASLAKWAGDFESPPNKRCSLLRRCAGFSDADARHVITRIESVHPHKPGIATLASASGMRMHRLRFIGAAWELLEDTRPGTIHLFTLVPKRGWDVKGKELINVQPRAYLERFRQQLQRAGSVAGNGWLIACLHGDYDPAADSYQLHIHIIATGRIADVVAKLKLLPMYRNAGRDESRTVRTPFLESRWGDPARRISYYLAQGFWPSKPTYIKDGVTRRARGRRRIPDPRFGEFLMWLDRQYFFDLLLMKGCMLSSGRLVATRARESTRNIKPNAKG